jgi:hypothetical protein
MSVIERLQGPLWVDFCPTRTDQWRPTLLDQRRTGFGQFRSVDRRRSRTFEGPLHAAKRRSVHDFVRRVNCRYRCLGARLADDSC